MKNCTHFPFFINGFKSDMAKSALRKNTFSTLLLLGAMLVSGGAWGQSVWNVSTNAGAWLTSGNWTPSGVPTSSDIAQFGVNPSSSPYNVGINMNGSTNNGSNAQIVGAIEVTSARNNPLVIGNSSTTANGTLTLNGISVNSVSNVVLRNNSSGLLTLQNTAGSGNKTMGVVLGNSTNNIILIDGAGGITISSVITGANQLTKDGSGGGTLTLSGANTYSGGTTINSGTLALGAAGVLADAGAVNVNGGILSCGTFSETIGALTLTSGSITGTTGTLTPSSTTASAGTISKIIGGTGTFTKNNSGTVTLSGANTYSGGTTINSGILQLGAAGVLADAGQIILSGGTLSTGATTGFSETVGTLQLTSSSTIALGTNVHTLTFANSSAVSWTAGQTLTITGWTGTAGASGTAGKIVVGAGGLTAAQLAQITFNGYAAGAAIVSGEVVPAATTPTLTVSPTSLTGFTYVQGSGPSTSQSYNLSGTNLTGAPGNITVSASTNYEVSTDNSTFSSTSVTVAYTSATLAATPVYVRLKAGLTPGSYNSELVTNAGGGATTQNVTCSGTVTSPPAISVSPASLTGFTYVQGSGPSTAQSYNLSGTNLTPASGNLTITGSTNFEVSLSSSSGFGASVTRSYTGGALASTPIYVRLKAGLSAGSYNGELVTNAGGGATTQNVTCDGSVTVPPPTLTVTPTSLSGFTYIVGNGPSTSQSYNLSGANLTGFPDNITITGSTNYEVSTDNASFSGSVTVAYTSATLAATPIYVRLKAGLSVGSYNGETIANAGGGATTQNVTCNGSVANTPVITVTPTSLTGFTYVQGSGPSTAQSYSLSGANLSPASGNITITGSANYEVSLSSGSGFGASVTKSYTGGALASTLIYVRLKAGLSTGSYNGELVANSGGGATTQNVTCDGSVSAPPPVLTVSPTSLTGFTYFQGNGPSNSQFYNLSGTNLTGFPDNITITGSTNYEVSTDNATFAGAVTVAYTSATLTATPIYVRLKAGLAAGSYNSEIIANSGGGASTKNVTCSGSVAIASATTITAGAGAEPVSISSLSNTQVGAVQNFDIVITDDGGSGGDNLSTLISQMVFTQGTGNGVSNWTLAIAGAELSDGTNSMTGTVASSTITFAGISTADLGLVADNAAKTYTLKVWLKTDMTTLKTTIDGSKLVFRIQTANITVSASGSQMAASQDQNSGSTNNAIDVQATTLAFVQNTSNANVGAAMSPSPTVSANDANGNRDLGYVTAISMTSTGTLTGSPVSATPSSGLATFSTLTHTAAGTGLILTAASGILSNATSNTFTINDVTLASDYFRSNATGTWATAANWQSSHDNSTWITATLSPTSSANTITIQSGNVITISVSVTIDQVVVSGTLNCGVAAIPVSNGTGDDIIVQSGGVLIYSVSSGTPSFATNATVRVNSGGILRVQAGGMTANGAGVNNGTTHFYDDGAYLEYDVSTNFSASGVTYFPGQGASSVPTFRVTSTFAGSNIGGSSNTIINGLFESNASFTFTGSGTKTFRNGISGTGNLDQNGAGQFIINGASAVLSGGSLTLSSSGLSVNSSANITASKVIAGTGPLSKQGSGTLTLSGANTYTGGTTISAGTVELGAANVLANTGAIILAGGTLSTGSGTGNNETVGTLQLTSSSTIALGTGVHTLTFANSSGVSWTAGQTLTITGWTGTAGASGTAGKIVVGASGLTAAQLAQVTFSGYSAGAAILSGELVPVGPSIAISAAHPATSNYALGSTNNIVAGFKLDVTVAAATLTGVTVTTSGTYQIGDIQTSGFRFWINSTNSLSGASQLGNDQAVVSSGQSVGVSGLSQVITAGTTQYVLFTADIAANAVNGRTIGVTATPNTNFSFISGTKSGSAGASNLSSLPIRLISFQAQAQGRSTLLKWATATEENNRFFSIERSSNGIDFREIGKVDGAGDSYEVRNYAFTDENPLAGINYYRLKQTDFDSHFSYSPVESVTFEAKGGLRLAPTPVQNQLRVELDDCCPENANWQVYDFTGRLVLSGKVQAETPVFNLDVENLLPGNYVLRVSSGQTTLTKQFQK